jgi:hypothetical protein
MPTSKSITLGASGVIVLAALAHLARPACPAAAKEVSVTSSYGDLGTLNNAVARPRDGATEIQAMDNYGRHRLLKSFAVPSTGTYRISFETQYEGTSGMAVELGGGSNQNYGIMYMDIRNGSVTKTSGDIAGWGVEPVAGRSGRYRWHVDMAYRQGRGDVNLAFVSVENAVIFPGHDCKVALYGLSYAKLPD